MKPRHKRFALIAAGIAALGFAAFLVLNAFEKNLVFFFTPTQVAANEAPKERTFRIGGLVQQGSLKRQPDGVSVHFIVTDTAQNIPVVYRGVLPDLFKEGKGVVAQGRLGPDGAFVASEVLAKHDENYMPPEAKDALDKAHMKGVAAQAANTLERGVAAQAAKTLEKGGADQTAKSLQVQGGSR
jgi:cytochrome c-type biogenesis protein CcmE